FSLLRAPRVPRRARSLHRDTRAPPRGRRPAPSARAQARHHVLRARLEKLLVALRRRLELLAPPPQKTARPRRNRLHQEPPPPRRTRPLPRRQGSQAQVGSVEPQPARRVDR